MNVLITICARGGSKGIPRKNLKEINNVPIIGYTINSAKKISNYFNNADIALSTENPEIKSVAETLGLSTDYSRPLKYATDNAGKIDVIKDILLFQEEKSGKRYDYILDLDVTSPLRSQSDLINSFEIINSDPECQNLFSVSPSRRNPYFNMIQSKNDGFYELVKKGSFKTRQSAPKVYDMNASFYYYRRQFFDSGYTTAICDKSLIYCMPHICFDIDEEIDYEFMSFLIKNNKLDFDL